MIRLLLSFAILLLPTRALAFPEMVRHGYTHCTACHTSIVGGNLLNEYGRNLAREVLSQKTLMGRPSIEGDEKFLYGIAQTPDWLLLGGDIRLLQYFRENENLSTGRFLIMQVELDASAQLSARFRAFGSIGRVEPTKSDARAKDFIYFPRYGLEFLMTHPEAENRVSLRAGRFVPAYGINFAEHTLVTRSKLNFGPGLERHAAELAWNNDNQSVIATAIFSRARNLESRREAGGAIQVTTSVREKSKIGLNYYETQGEPDDKTKAVRPFAPDFTKRMYGAFAHMTFNEHWYALLEYDRTQNDLEKWGTAELFKLGYEVHQGLQVFGMQEYFNENTEESNPRFEAYSLGTQWFPRPHWDLLAVYRKEGQTAAPTAPTSGSDKFDDVVWLIGHFYL